MLENNIEELCDAVRQNTLAIETVIKVIQASVGVQATIQPSACTVVETPSTLDPNGNDDFNGVDWDSLDIMDCPYDSAICSSGKTKYKDGHKHAGCWIKKKGVDEQVYLDKRRLLIVKRQDHCEDITPLQTETPNSIFDTAPPPSIPQATPSVFNNNPPPTIPQTPTTLPQIDVGTIDQTQFHNLCRTFCQMENAAENVRHLSFLLQSCGLKPDDTPESVPANQTDVMQWIASKIYEHAAQ